MGRRIPNDNISLIEPFVQFSFSFVGLVASISLITFLCSVGFRRKKTPETLNSSPEAFETKALNAFNLPSTMESPTMSPEPPQMQEIGKSNIATEEDNNEILNKELPLPPAMQAKHMSMNMNMSSSMRRDTSVRRTSFSLSMKMPRTLSMAKNRDNNQKEDNEGGKKWKLKTDESVWMKTIILGEKCVLDEEEEEAITYEGKGKRISFSAYHPRQSTSMSISRQCSFIEQEALNVSQAQLLEERMKQ